jgi:hypothetical protein
MAKSTTLDIILRMRDEASKGLKSFHGSLKGAEDASKKFGLALAGVGVAAVGLAGKLAIDAAQNERTQLTFDALAKSIDASAEVMDNMRAATLGLVDDVSLMESGNKLMAMGLAGSEDEMAKLMNTAVRLGGAMGSGPTESMENFALMLANQSIPRLDTFGISSGRVRARIEELMGANADMSRETAFMTATLEAAETSLGKLGDHVPTVGEKFEQMKVNLINAKQAIGEQLIPVFAPLIEKMADFAVNKLPSVIQSIGVFITKIQQLSSWLMEHKSVLIIVAGVIIGGLLPAIYAAITGFVAAAVALAPFLIGGAIIGGVVAGIVWMVKHWDIVKEKVATVWETISNSIIGKVALIVSGPFGALIAGVMLIVRHWDEIKAATEAVWNGIKNYFVTTFENIKANFLFFTSFVVGLVDLAFQSMGINIFEVFASIIEFISVFWAGLSQMFSEGLVTISEFWGEMWGSIRDKGQEIWGGLKNGVKDLWDSISAMFRDLTAPVVEAWGGLWEAIKEKSTAAARSIGDVVKGMINSIIDKINSFISMVNNIAKAGGEKLGIPIPALSQIPRLAKGGIVTSPTLALIGEAGPEAVVPLSGANGRAAAAAGFGGGGGLVINFNGPVMTGRDHARMLADELALEIKRRIKV